MAQIATFYAGAMSEAREIELAPSPPASVASTSSLIGANDPDAMAPAHARSAAPAASPSSPIRPSSSPSPTAPASAASSTAPTYLFTNEYEAHLTEQKTGWNHDEILDRVGTRVITRGADGVTIHRRGEETSPCRSPARCAGPTRPASATPSGPASSPGSRGSVDPALRRARLDAGDLRHRDGRHPGVRPRQGPLPRAARRGLRRRVRRRRRAAVICPGGPDRRSARRAFSADACPPADRRLGLRPRRRAAGRGPHRRRRRPRGRARSRRLLPRHLPHGPRRPRAADGLVVARPARRPAPPDLRVTRSLRKSMRPLRGPRRHRLRARWSRPAPTPPATAGGSRREPSHRLRRAAPGRLGPLGRDLARRRARRGSLRRRRRRALRGGVDVPPVRDASKAALVGPCATCSPPTATRAGSSTCSGAPTTSRASASSSCRGPTTSRSCRTSSGPRCPSRGRDLTAPRTSTT